MKRTPAGREKYGSRNPLPAGPLVPLLAFLGLAALAFPLRAQTSTGTGSTAATSNQFDTSDFPLWGKDLRRAEIIAFGTFPFTMFTATFFMDTWRTYNHDWDTRYAPWPFKTAGAISMTTKEHEMTMSIACIASLALALTDYIIVQIKRYRARQRVLQLPEGSPIIIKRPWPENAVEEGALPPETPGNTSAAPGIPADLLTP
ncbi:MAG: hypothetical protein LBE14_01025 [Treponema sp.]|jgi:hypothetical protein|nr:hypothetical protein [Treponema sp.]